MTQKEKYILGGLGVVTFLGLVIGFLNREAIIEFILTKEQQLFISNLHPKAKKIFENLIKLAQSLGYNVIVTSGYRTFAKQAELKKLNPKNATPGLSTHNYGIALDINLLKGTKLWNKTTSTEEWLKTGIPQKAKEMGLRWGGDAFAGYHDPVHFDIPLKTSELLAQAKKQFGNDPEKIKGNEVFIA